MRILSPDLCIFYNPSPKYIRCVSIAYSQSELVGLRELHSIYFQESAEHEKVCKMVKEEDECFWGIAQERKKLGEYS